MTEQAKKIGKLILRGITLGRYKPKSGEEKSEETKRGEWYRVTGVPAEVISKLDLQGLSYKDGMYIFYFQANSLENLKDAKEKIGKYIDIEKVKIEKY